MYLPDRVQGLGDLARMVCLAGRDVIPYHPQPTNHYVQSDQLSIHAASPRLRANWLLQKCGLCVKLK